MFPCGDGARPRPAGKSPPTTLVRAFTRTKDGSDGRWPMTEQLFSKMALIGFIGFGLSASAQNTPPLTPQNPAQQQTSQPSPQQAGSDQAGSDESVSQPKSAQPSPAQGNGAPRIAPGSVIPVQLTRSIAAKKVKVGEAVEGRVMQDLKAANGQGVVPKETRVVGHVTEVQARSKEQKESQIGI